MRLCALDPARSAAAGNRAFVLSRSRRTNHIDCRYLYVSRQSLRLPSLVEIDDDALTWLAGDTQGKSLRTILERVELVPEENAAELERLGFTAENWDQPIGVEERSILDNCLLTATLRIRF